jgi:hypothetical protein
LRYKAKRLYIAESNCKIMTTMVDYGYGNAIPDTSAENYGYNDDAPDYGYGEAKPDTTGCGYGDSQPDYGYGDAKPDTDTTDSGSTNAQPEYGYGNGRPDGNTTDDDQQPKRRNRRRNSVTRYSIVCQDAVKNEFEAHASVIDQFRNGGLNSPTGPPPIQQIETHEALNDFPGVQVAGASSHSRSDDGRSFEGSLDDLDGGDHKDADNSRKKNRGWGFRLGRSSTN